MALSPLAGITPDEMQLVRKRQQWRAKVLRICVDVLEQLEPHSLGLAENLSKELRATVARFGAISDHVREDMQRLLESEMLVPQLDSKRHAANYFLDTVIGYARERADERNVRDGKRVNAPLESLPAEELDLIVREALSRSSDAIGVFLKNLIHLEEFDLEVRNQRKRLQYLLGCDRNLRDLAESNSEIIEAPLDKFDTIVERFFATCQSLSHDLGPLLQIKCPYPKLHQELLNARDQLHQIERDIFAPMEELRSLVAAFDTRFKPLHRDVDRLLESVREILRSDLGGGLGDTASGAIKILPVVKLKTLLATFQAALRALAFDRLGELNSFLGTLAGSSEESLTPEAEKLRHELERLGEEVTSDGAKCLEQVANVLQQAEIVNRSIDVGELRSCLGRLHDWLEVTVEPRLVLVSQAVTRVRDVSALRLKQRICQEMGFIRTTFLQPCFAHIAADDPRSLHTPQYFYFKEFAEEAKQSQQLLERIHGLWQYIEHLQTTKIQGLRFTPNNLNKIAKRVLQERRTVPAGPGWKELERFLHCLKGELVDKLEAACALVGVRFDDRNELSAYADRVTEDCAMLLAKRETAYKLIKELDRMSVEEGQDEIRDRYRSTILRVICQDMADKLRSLSQTLLEMIPYVGAMVGGIRMRTSLSFVEATSDDE